MSDIRSWRDGRYWFRAAGIILCVLITIMLTMTLNAQSGSNSISIVDEPGYGEFSSMALDADGFPIISCYRADSKSLMLYHCNDPNCVGGDESHAAPGFVDDVGQFTSLTLDGDGYPVVSYYDLGNKDLKLLHCSHPDCGTGDRTITSPDTAGDVGLYTSVSLDSAGNPVVSYYDLGNQDLKLLHCNDPNCEGGDESITSPDQTGDVGRFTSLALDSAGYPVVSYYDGTNDDLKLMHCNDPNCTGGDESITSPDQTGDVGQFSSLTLDSAGYPIVSYYDSTNRDLKLTHCNDPNCAGGDESITVPDAAGDIGWENSLVLDGDGYPVVSYHDGTNGDLKLLHCNDPDCAGGDESIFSPDLDKAGRYSSLALDSDGNPVVSYMGKEYYWDWPQLRLLHCGGPDCIVAPPNDDFDNAITIDDMPFLDDEITLAATISGDDPILPCALGQGFNTVWYQYTPYSDELLTINTQGSDYDTVLAIWEGSRGSLVNLACNDDAGSAQSHLENILLSGGVTYSIEVASNSEEPYHLFLSADSEVLFAGSWENVGSPGFSAGEVSYIDIAVDSGTPYVAFIDYGNDNKATVMKYDGSSWVNVGSPGFSAGPSGYTSLALDGSTPYVAYTDYGNDSKATVMKYDGSSWVNVGSPGFSTGLASSVSLALDGSTPYVAYRDGGNDYKATVMKYDGSSWMNVGSPGFSAGYSDDIDLALDGSTPYVAYRDGGNDSKATVMKYDGSSWVNVGSPGFSEGEASSTDIAMDGSTLYVAYMDVGNDYKATVMRYDGSWQPVGPEGFSKGEAYYTNIVIDESTPFVVYTDEDNADRATVMKYENDQWQFVGPAGFSAGEAYYTDIAMDGSTPYVVYMDSVQAYKATVMTYLPGGQELSLNSGWNMISSYMDPANCDLDTMFAPIAGKLILVKDGLGQVYWPDQGIDTIGCWDPHNGYQIFMLSSANLLIQGGKVVPEAMPIDLDAGWSIVSYCRDNPLAVGQALASIESELVLVKNGFGEVFWPAYGVDQIVDMQPGEGYQPNLSAAATLNYPPNDP